MKCTPLNWVRVLNRSSGPARAFGNAMRPRFASRRFTIKSCTANGPRGAIMSATVQTESVQVARLHELLRVKTRHDPSTGGYPHSYDIRQRTDRISTVSLHT